MPVIRQIFEIRRDWTMALKFDEQLSLLQKPDRAEMTDKEYQVFNKNVNAMENLRHMQMMQFLSCLQN